MANAMQVVTFFFNKFGGLRLKLNGYQIHGIIFFNVYLVEPIGKQKH